MTSGAPERNIRRRSRFVIRGVLSAAVFSVVLAALAPPAAADAAGDDASRRREARECFTRALVLADAERLQEAVVQFRRAYELAPHYAVQYNLGKAYAKLGMPVEAVDAYEAYLRDGSDEIPAPRRAEVSQAVAEQRARIALLALHVEPAGAAVFVDDRPVGTAPLTDPVRLGMGVHSLRVSLSGHRVFAQQLTLAGKERHTMQIRLEPEAALATSVERGLLALRCELPDVALRLGGRTLGVTPLAAPLALPPGRHTLELARGGYRTRRLSVEIASAALVEAPCALQPEPKPAQAGVVHVAISEPHAELRIDGAAAPERGALPAGRHAVQVTRAGFEPWRRTVHLRAGERVTLQAELVPEAVFRREYEARAGAQRTWAWVLAGSGVALAGTAVALFAWNEGRHADWQKADESLQRQAAMQLSDSDADALRQRQDENNELLTSIQRLDAVTLTTGVVGVLLGAAGGFLFLTGDDPDRYRGVTLRAAPDAALLTLDGRL